METVHIHCHVPVLRGSYKAAVEVEGILLPDLDKLMTVYLVCCLGIFTGVAHRKPCVDTAYAGLWS